MIKYYIFLKKQNKILTKRSKNAIDLRHNEHSLCSRFLFLLGSKSLVYDINNKNEH